ncbi:MULTISPECIES: fumarylacetoacetate hydrolase family protein [unclassified Burkholderia]|uniref:fumarylacetoacetate hydrolase family protein n=1 Tax=unclassified Burkholderia TaxID=2613784 RepID=UPI000469A4ED|nr:MULTISPECIES: fumarylacetoacetate hydrolase family protein [unclassified Burkholderia]NIE82357.1 fumarylacetoacetate hydrolase family protein [Burkholderia sp. Tr-860]NIF61643.1 fumarylacetoacetate hydrolase family protein [Burkholderia sp. Cy-647]NIF71148.1 fumarylacetoacetate hydrolase family protein [Burkholderia sp. Ap-962]NIF96165.1 fumarylacetoacetate hydrolase family protein [Burkholderia sp. Ax-1720]
MRFANVVTNGVPTASLVSPNEADYWPVSELIPGFVGGLEQVVRQFAELEARLSPASSGRPLDPARIVAPLDRLHRNIFCVGKNYHEHAAEFQRSGFDSSAKDGEHAPEAPVIFTKPPSTVIGPGAPIPRHAGVTNQLDYEAELGVVIGRAGAGIRKADAMKHVFGYTVINDVTARDLQKLHRQWFIGKALDGFCPMGPYLVTADEVDGRNLGVTCWVNGELRQQANTRQLIFDIPTLIETISAGIELQPGDVIATGTPAGVGIGFDPPRFLQSGDLIRIEIEGVGVLENQVGS